MILIYLQWNRERSEKIHKDKNDSVTSKIRSSNLDLGKSQWSTWCLLRGLCTCVLTYVCVYMCAHMCFPK